MGTLQGTDHTLQKRMCSPFLSVLVLVYVKYWTKTECLKIRLTEDLVKERVI